MTQDELARIFGLSLKEEKAMGQTVTLGFGKASYTHTVATYACFKITPPFDRVTAATSGVNKGRTVTQAGVHEHNGTLVSSNVEHDNGTVILLQVKWQRGATLVREGGLFFRLRAGAPLYNVIAAVPTEQGNVCGDSFQMFSGHADIVNTDELKLLSIEVNRGYVSRYMARDELAECFKIVQVVGETMSRPAISAIATPTGLEMREVAQMPVRRMILRRGQ